MSLRSALGAVYPRHTEGPGTPHRLFTCNCEGFVPSTAGFEAFAGFVRKHQVNRVFLRVLRAHGRRSAAPGGARGIATQRVKDARVRCRDARHRLTSRAARTKAARKTTGAAVEQWLSVLNVLYGLRNMFPEDLNDHVYLRGAAIALLGASRPERHKASRSRRSNGSTTRPARAARTKRHPDD